jgi:hypothetical protein
VLALELGPCTAATLHPFARMGIMTMSRMPAHPTATTGPIGSTAACLLALGHGSTGFTAGAAIGAAVVFTGAAVGDAAAGDAAALTAVALKVAAADLRVAAASRDADLDSPGEAASRTAVAAVGSTAVAAVGSTAVAAVGSMAAVAVDSMAAVAVDSMAVVEVMAAATGK